MEAVLAGGDVADQRVVLAQVTSDDWLLLEHHRTNMRCYDERVFVDVAPSPSTCDGVAAITLSVISKKENIYVTLQSTDTRSASHWPHRRSTAPCVSSQ
jgi:hypothetical protein